MHTDTNCQNYQYFQKRPNARIALVQSVDVSIQMGLSVSHCLNDVRAMTSKEFHRDEELILTLSTYLDRNFQEITEQLKAELFYDISRLTIIDRAILSVALSELKACPLTTRSIIIDEYIELTKKYSEPASKKSINAILDALAKKEVQLHSSEEYCDS